MKQEQGTKRMERKARAQRRTLIGAATIGLLSLEASLASRCRLATVTTPCTGSGYKCDTSGYGKVANKSTGRWLQATTARTTFAYRLIQDGMPKNITWLHNGGDWAREAKKHHIPVDKTPTVGSVAQWNSGAGGMSSSGHVAYVIAVTPDSITVAEDNYSAGPMDVRVITKGDPAWPSHFIHFSAAAMTGKGARWPRAQRLAAIRPGLPQRLLCLTFTPHWCAVRFAGWSVHGRPRRRIRRGSTLAPSDSNSRCHWRHTFSRSIG